MNSSDQWLKRCLAIVLVLVVLEGAIRKWLLPGFNEYVYFAKDGVLGIAYLLALLRSEGSMRGSGFKLLVPIVFIAASLVAAGVINPALGSIVVGLFGLKSYLWYVPLIWVVPMAFDSSTELERGLRRYLLIVIPVCLLGVAQFSAPADSLLNRYSNSGEDGHIVVFGEGGGHARITGTFPYISGFTNYLTVMGIFLLALMGQPAGGVWFLIGATQFVLIMGNAFMSGSRAPVFILAGTTVAFLFSTAGQTARALVRFRWAVIAVMLLGVGTALYGFRDAFSAFLHRVETAGDTEERLALVNVDSIDGAVEAAGWLGFGTGATLPGGAALRTALSLDFAVDEPPPAEAEYLRVMLELGTVGFLVWYAVRVYVLWALFITWRRMRIPFLRQVAFAAFFLHLVTLNGGVIVSSTMGVYYWFSAGFIFLLPKLHAVELSRLTLLSQMAGIKSPLAMPARRRISNRQSYSS